jgi:hypothetical protein
VNAQQDSDTRITRRIKVIVCTTSAVSLGIGPSLSAPNAQYRSPCRSQGNLSFPANVTPHLVILQHFLDTHNSYNMFKTVTTHAARRVAQPSSFAARRHLHAPLAFDWKDPLGSNNLYTEEEAAIAEVAEDYCQERMLPRVLGKQDIYGLYRQALH